MAAEASFGPMDSAVRSISLSRIISICAAGLSILVALGPPSALLLSAYMEQGAASRYEGHAIARKVTEIVATSPDAWSHRHLNLMEALMAVDTELSPQQLRMIRSLQGDVLARVSPSADASVAWPSLRNTVPIYDQGEVVGDVVLIDGMRTHVLSAGLLAVVSTIVALLVFTLLRVLPLRMLRRATSRASWLASHDPLTGLANRTLFAEKLREALARARRDGSSVALIGVDLDHFKEVNDTLGHAAGDQLLCQVADRLRANIRETDVLARFGGDEFVILQTQARQPENAQTLAERLSGLLAEPFQLDGHQVVIGGSLGIALGERGNRDGARLMQQADLAMYQAKEDGRGGFRFYDASMNERLQRRKALENDLRQALAEGQFSLVFQPQVQMVNGTRVQRITGAEALLRWQHPVTGNMPPDQFIPLAEQTNLILPIGEWVLREACRTAAAWPEALTVAVNVSTVQFRQPGFVALVERVLAETGLPGRRLELEITESIMVADTAESVATMSRLRSLGIKLAMDDFGTGYSSLGYLRQFKFDKIKIDKSFIKHLGERGESEAIVRAVVGMSHAMGVQSNAEGVETEHQSQMLLEEGCTEMQGYLFGRPMSATAFAELIDSKPGLAVTPTSEPEPAQANAARAAPSPVAAPS